MFNGAPGDHVDRFARLGIGTGWRSGARVKKAGDGQVYGFDGDEGGEVQLKCLTLSSGEVCWSFSGLGAGSLFVADNHFIVLSESGELLIAPVSNESFSHIAKAKILDGKCWTVPVLCNGLIYCRNASGEIACVNVSLSLRLD